PHCRASYELPVDDTHPDARWHVARIISEAINTTLWPVPGPVHINVPLREPLYPEKDLHYKSEFRAVQLTPPQTNLTDQQWDELLKIWHKCPRRLIVAGMYPPDKDILSYLQKLSKDSNTAIIFDITSNMHGGLNLHHSDMILGTRNLEKLKALQPDLLITFGGPVVSKNLKLFLRKFKPRLHWQLQLHSRCIDTFQSLTHILPVSPDYFFTRLVERTQRVTSSTSEKSNSYQKFWSECEERASRALGNFLEKAPHSEFTAMNLILKSLPPKCNLHLGNSFVVRVANFIGLQGTQGVRVNSNRGTNGIDGTVSTAVGAALVNDELTCLITGDLAFFYDRNGLWQHDLPANLRIIIINNQGGGIFRILDGAKDLPELDQFFEVEHHLTAENTARDFGLDYFCCEDSKSLKTCLKKFFQPSKRPAIMEIKTNKYVNAETFEKFKKIMWEEL
ncbi:MAG: 2-succinyl-5-enolpyruvyl-6-hydroxy-3-cyclohexene-1-carboxylic-acid synthase, partial [Calditrichaeota bacterium]